MQSPVSDNGNTAPIAFYGFRGGPGGISHVMLNLMNAIRDTGRPVDILLHRTDIPELASLHPAVRRVELGPREGVGRLVRLIRYLRAENPAAILVNREPANRTATLARLLSRSRVKLVVRVGMAISSALERRGPLKRFLRRLGIVFCYRRADVVIANARGVADDIVAVTGLPYERIDILDNPTVTSDIQVLAEEPSGHPWLDETGPPVILGVGRLARQKDFACLIEAFALVRQESACRLVIIGEGKERPALEEIAARRGVAEEVSLPGFTPNPFAYMRRAALFVLSSAWEGSPNVLIQAMALGIPSVSTDCPGGSREIMEGGRHGPLVPVGDVAALASAIRKSLDAPVPAAQLVAATARFRADRCARAYLEAIGLEDASS